MTCPLRLSRLIAVLGVVSGMAGCNLTTSQLTHFYVLTPLERADWLAPIAGDKLELSLGVGPVTLPRYLDRPQIVTRLDANRLDMAEFEQWAEPLQESVIRILAENLSLLLSTHQIEVFPWQRSARFDYQIVVTILQFESHAAAETVLTARWVLYDAGGEEEQMRNAFTVTVPQEAHNYQSIVSAMSRALGALSRDIAVSLRALAQASG
jgi:uncharacterized lipoprotein YmbA